MLLLDIGNSRLKWATWDGGALEPGGARAHDGDPASLLPGLPGSDTAWICHVLGADAEQPLAAALEKRGTAPRFARTQPQWNGLRIAYADPGRLGVDRWLTMVALQAEQTRPFCVASAGTALTFDAVDASGRHLGGLIAPGLVTAQRALLGAARFGVRPGEPAYGDGLGQDTESCVSQGALHAALGMIERAVRPEHGARFITGGDAAMLLPHLRGGWQLRPHLVLEGLLALARGAT